MSEEPETIAAPSSDETLLSEYEDLRGVALGRPKGPSQGAGFALFLRRGMAAWMEACASVARASSPRPLPRQEQRLMPADLRGEVALVLAAMALASCTEGGMAA